MSQARRQPHLALEPGECHGIEAAVELEHLHSARPAHQSVLGHVHLSHSAFADFLVQHVVAEALRPEGGLSQTVQGVRHEHRRGAEQRCPDAVEQELLDERPIRFGRPEAGHGGDQLVRG